MAGKNKNKYNDDYGTRLTTRPSDDDRDEKEIELYARTRRREHEEQRLKSNLNRVWKNKYKYTPRVWYNQSNGI